MVSFIPNAGKRPRRETPSGRPYYVSRHPVGCVVASARGRCTVTLGSRAGQLDRAVDDGPVRCRPRRSQSSKLDPYKRFIETRLAGYLDHSAVRLLEEIWDAGYEGGYDQVKRNRTRIPAGSCRWPVQRLGTSRRRNQGAGGHR